MTPGGYRPPSGDSPCKECPFRRSSAAGWLGDATPQSFIAEISLERPLPCHPTIDYADPDWLEKWTAQSIGRICAGSLIMSANMGKLPRDPAFPRLPPDDEAVFRNHLQFIAHHEGAQVRSWELAEDAPKEIRVTKTKTRPPEIAVLNDDQLKQLIEHSRIGRQNAHTRTLRTDAHAALSAVHAEAEPGPPMELCAKKFRELSSNPDAIGVHAIERSPMNRQRWTLSMLCGHDTWVTSRTRPSQRLASCEICRKRAQAASGPALLPGHPARERGAAPPANGPAGEPRRRRFSVRIDVEIEVDQRIIDAATDEEWRGTFYDLGTAQDVAGHLAYNLVQGSRLTSLDGFADQEDGMARIWEIDYDVGDVEEVLPDPPKPAARPRRTRPARPAGRGRRGKPTRG